MTDLPQALAEATGPDRELDARIWCGVNDYRFVNGAFGIISSRRADGGWADDKYLSKIPHYTGSIDSALTLIPDQENWEGEIGRHKDWHFCHLHGPEEETPRGKGFRAIRQRGKTTAIAICIAALKAIEYEKTNSR